MLELYGVPGQTLDTAFRILTKGDLFLTVKQIAQANIILGTTETIYTVWRHPPGKKTYVRKNWKTGKVWKSRVSKYVFRAGLGENTA